MTLSIHPRIAKVASTFAVLALPALAAVPIDPPTAERGVRIVVTTRDDHSSAGEVMTRTANLARVPVRDVQDLSGLRYRMTLVCPDEAACRAAMARIAADRSFALGVDIEDRQQIPARPTRDTSR